MSMTDLISALALEKSVSKRFKQQSIRVLVIDKLFTRKVRSSQ